jgi:L-rhamnose mutarotase
MDRPADDIVRRWWRKMAGIMETEPTAFTSIHASARRYFSRYFPTAAA